jgi:hypothetical protein
MGRKKEMAIYQRRVVVIGPGGNLVNALRPPEQVRVMARAEGYAMVRRPSCAPFIVSEKELAPLQDSGSNE